MPDWLVVATLPLRMAAVGLVESERVTMTPESGAPVRSRARTLTTGVRGTFGNPSSGVLRKAPDGDPMTSGSEPGGCGTPATTLVETDATLTVTSVGTKTGPGSDAGLSRIARSVIFTSSGRI